MKYALFYESVEGFMEKVPLHFAEHRALWQKFHAEGSLLLVGPFTDVPGTALAIFRSRESAGQFVALDPFVRHGIVSRWTIREWKEALLP